MDAGRAQSALAGKLFSLPGAFGDHASILNRHDGIALIPEVEQSGEVQWVNSARDSIGKGCKESDSQ
jgi:hypothetical protein